MIKFWRKQTNEILSDPILVASGISLTLMNILTVYFWWTRNALMAFSAQSSLASCHAFFPQCRDWISFDPSSAKMILVFYGMIALVTLGLMIKKSTRSWALMLLAGVTLFKFCLFLSRFNMLGNYHLIHFLLAFTFFFLPKKRASLTLCLVMFYFLAGTLKLNLEWLSGATLLTPSILEGKVLSLALSYVVVLELLLVWGLFSSYTLLRVLTLFQLFCFHVFSWHIVGYFYPLTMLLALVPVFMMLFPRYKVIRRDFRPPRSALLFFLGLTFFNVIPTMTHEDPALEGRFRGLRINMLDARAVCYPLAYVESPNEINFVELNQVWAVRTHCDPTTFESQLRNYCMVLEESQRLNFYLYSKRSVDLEFKLVRNMTNFCGGRHDSVY